MNSTHEFASEKRLPTTESVLSPSGRTEGGGVIETGRRLRSEVREELDGLSSFYKSNYHACYVEDDADHDDVESIARIMLYAFRSLTLDGEARHVVGDFHYERAARMIEPYDEIGSILDHLSDNGLKNSSRMNIEQVLRGEQVAPDDFAVGEEGKFDLLVVYLWCKVAESLISIALYDRAEPVAAIAAKWLATLPSEMGVRRGELAMLVATTSAAVGRFDAAVGIAERAGFASFQMAPIHLAFARYCARNGRLGDAIRYALGNSSSREGILEWFARLGNQEPIILIAREVGEAGRVIEAFALLALIWKQAKEEPYGRRRVLPLLIQPLARMGFAREALEVFADVRAIELRPDDNDAYYWEMSRSRAVGWAIRELAEAGIAFEEATVVALADT